jgi:hypothetical protein
MAGGKANTFIDDLLLLIFNATPIANIADNAASSPLTHLYLALHTADPGVGGNQTSNEATYTPYARVSVARTSAGFLVSGSACTLVAAAVFPTPTAGAAEVEPFFSLGTAASGTGKILYRGPITPNITIALGTPPQLTTGTTVTEA